MFLPANGLRGRRTVADPRPVRVLRGDAPRLRPRRCRTGEGLPPESKTSKRLTWLGVTILVAFGLVVPALVLADNGNHKASVAVGGVHLNADQVKAGNCSPAPACTATR